MGVSYTKNVAGDFYVEDECCITCGVPVDIAPDVFEFDEHSCYVKKQPTTPDEVERTLEVMNNQEVDCIHYKGADREIVRRLVESGEGHNCDSRLRDFFQERLRNVVRLTFPASSPRAFLEVLLAKPKQEKRYDGALSYSFKSARIESDSAIIAVSWYEANFHTMEVTLQADGTFLLRLTASARIAGHGFSRLIHGWLQQLPNASDILWMTEEEFRTGGGQPAPF